MTWNITAEFTALVMLGIIIIYSRKGSQLPTLKNKMFLACLLITFGAIFTNILSTVMIYNYHKLPLWTTWLVTTFYFILTPLMGMTYFYYTTAVIYPNKKFDKKRNITLGFPGLLYILLILINPFTGIVFQLTDREGYTHGPLIFSTYIIFYIYCFACIIITVTNRRTLEKQVAHILTAFPLLAFSVIFFQQLYPDIILSGSAATCALLIIYLHLQNKQISLDYLTNLPNRQELLDMLSLLLTRHPDRIFALAVISIRGFRQINSTCGQQNGDLFLKKISQFITQTAPSKNVYRFSGDEFAVLFVKEDKEEIRHYLHLIQQRMESPWQVKDYSFTLSTSVGIVSHTDSTQTLEEVLTSVEYAVHHAKTDSHSSICYCDRKMLQALERKNQIIQILENTLHDQSFEMYYQPIYEVSSGKFLFAESLMRMNDTPIGPIYPSEFIPIAEETGLLIDITYVILDKVCCFIMQLIALRIPIECIHVNFSGIQFSQPNLAQKVLDIINKHNTPSHLLKIEFTESALADTPEVVTQFSLEMERHGIMMGLDDFGTGYSNISTVISIPFGTIKLDKSLVDAAQKDKRASLTIRSVVQLFKELDQKVIAEGVETEEQRQMVADFGVDQIQGYYYSKPLCEKDMIEFLRKKNI